MKKEHAALIAAGLVAWAAWLHWLWQPERQLRLHQEHLLKAVERRNWKALSRLLADDYSDPWGGNRGETPGRAAEAFRAFFTLTVQGSGREQGEDGRISERIRIAGAGGPLAELLVDRVNSLTQPFVFTWVHRSGRPWDWRLRRLEQPELHLDPGEGL